jgi:hypothetical protein
MSLHSFLSISISFTTLLSLSLICCVCHFSQKQVFNLVHVMSNFGELRLRPSTLPHEAAFLANPSSMTHALKKRDVHVVIGLK